MLRTLEDRFRDAVDALRTAAHRYPIEPVRWIYGADEGIDWCTKCGTAEVERLRAKDPSGEYGLDGGWDLYHEKDGCAFCDKCGQPLGYALTNYGVWEETAHFLENGFLDGFGNFNPGVAFEVTAILEQAPYLDDDELKAAALHVGESASQLVGYSTELARFADDGCPNER